MVDGSSVTSGAIYPRMPWKIQEHQFRFVLRIMELGGWDIILGVDWMCHFIPITFDFHKLSIALSSEGELVHLQGFINQPVMELVRGKDLRTFIRDKQRCRASMQLDKINVQVIEARGEVKAVLQQFSKVFESPQGLPLERSWDHQITLKPGACAHKTKIE